MIDTSLQPTHSLKLALKSRLMDIRAAEISAI